MAQIMEVFVSMFITVTFKLFVDLNLGRIPKLASVAIEHLSYLNCACIHLNHHWIM